MLAYILSVLNDAVLAYNINEGRFIFISPVAEKISGYTTNDFYNDNHLLKKIIHPNDRQKFNEPLLDNTESPDQTEYAYRIITADKQVKWIKEKRVMFTQDDNGHQIVINIFRDITETIDYKATTDQKVWFLSSLINSVGAFIFRVDNRRNYAYVNDVYTQLLNYPKGALIGKSINMVVYPDDLQAIDGVIDSALANPGKVYHIRHRKLTSAGIIKWVVTDAVAVVNDSNQITEIQGVGIDITEQHRAEQEILLTKNNLEALLNNTRDLVWSIDTEKRYVFANTSFRYWIKLVYEFETQMGMIANDLQFFPEDVARDWNNYYDRALNGESFTLNHQERNPQTNITVTFEISFNPIRNNQDQIIGIGCFAHDITEKLTTQRSIMQQNEKLRSIASLSSHELRRPVATLMGLIDVLDKQNHSNPENYNVISHIDTVSRELDEVIRLIVNKTFIE